MIHYFTSREISETLEINLARWKRWSRSFLPPDPLGGMQSGYARQYVFKDLLKVFLGGHLLSHLKLSVPESQQVLTDLSPWLKKNGFFDLNGSNGADVEKVGQFNAYRIYFCPLNPTDAKGGSGFGYLIRQTMHLQSEVALACRQTMETFEETIIHSDACDGGVFLQDPAVRLINLTALCTGLVEKLYP